MLRTLRRPRQPLQRKWQQHRAAVHLLPHRHRRRRTRHRRSRRGALSHRRRWARFISHTGSGLSAQRSRRRQQSPLLRLRRGRARCLYPRARARYATATAAVRYSSHSRKCNRCPRRLCMRRPVKCCKARPLSRRRRITRLCSYRNPHRLHVDRSHRLRCSPCRSQWIAPCILVDAIIRALCLLLRL